LMLKGAREDVILPKLKEVLASLTNLAVLNADIPMLSRTHGQPASPTTLRQRCAKAPNTCGRQQGYYPLVVIFLDASVHKPVV